jgi:hypothetical protein
VKAVASLRERCDHNHRPLEKGADYLLYMLLDGLVDDYFPLLDLLDDLMDKPKSARWKPSKPPAAAAWTISFSRCSIARLMVTCRGAIHCALFSEPV